MTVPSRHGRGQDSRRAGAARGNMVFGAVIVLLILLVAIMRLRTPAAARIEIPSPDRTALSVALGARIDDATAGVNADPDDPEAWGRLGAIFDVHDMLADAIICYEQAERLDRREFRWPYLLGRCRMVGDQRAALADFERARALRDDYAPLHLRLGNGYVRLDDLDKAEAAFAHAAALDPTLARAHLGLGRVALARRDAEDALPHLDRAVTVGASSGELHGLLAEAHRRLGDLGKAAEHVELAADAVKLEPLPDPIHRELGWREGVTLRWSVARSKQHLLEGKIDAAVREWETATQNEPTSAQAHANLALLYAQAGRNADAIRSFTRAVELDPTRTNAQLDIGTLYIRQGDVTRGIEIMRGVCASHPEDVQARIRLSRALSDAKRMPEAEAVLQEALIIESNSAAALFEYGVLTGESGRMREAVDLFARSAGADPSSMRAHRNLARALYRLGRFGEAIDAVREGLTHLPDDIRLMNALAWMQATCPDETMRDGREAVRIAEKICRRTGYRDLNLLDTLGAAYAEAGEFDAALQSIQQAQELPAAENPNVVRRLESRRESYQRRRPIRDVNLNE